MVGLNDTKETNNKHETVEETFQKHKETCQKYKVTFENAELHIGAVAPVTQKQINLNSKLREYANENKRNGFSFIDNQELFDSKTKKLRSGMLNGIHYTDHALRHYAKSLRRSLYSKAYNRGLSSSHTTRTHQRKTAVQEQPLSSHEPRVQTMVRETASEQSVLMSAISELTKTTQAILQRVASRD